MQPRSTTDRESGCEHEIGTPRPHRNADRRDRGQHGKGRDRAPARACRNARGNRQAARRQGRPCRAEKQERKSVVKGKSVSVRLDLGGSRTIKKKKKKYKT